MSDDVDTWRMGVNNARSVGLGRTIKVYAPGCPASPHRERDCRCRTFSRVDRAEQYIEEQSNLAPE